MPSPSDECRHHYQRSGTFQPPLVSIGSANRVLAADFDGDGRLDLALVHFLGRQLVIYRNAGDLSFVASPGFTLTEPGPALAAAGDIDNDGDDDDAVTANSGPTISVFLGNGDATVQPGQTLSFAPAPCTIVVGCPCRSPSRWPT